ncbi:hypothetical protein [Paenibacillus turpanensis]|uniref:hypothetical protein n=1 Tax=Paenibacillus turpanensis TaxID=2689078 RepID=UPI0014085FF0|nr:hypothetical protein [Paenibacillus turpanensis]
MGNIEKFLYWTIGVLVTMLVISTGLLLWNKTKPIMTLANKEAAAQAQLITDAQFSAYDNQIVSGAQVVTAYRRYATQEAFYLYIRMYKSGTYTDFGMTPKGGGYTCPRFSFSLGQLVSGSPMSCSVKEEQITKFGGTYYVPPQASFRSTIVRDVNKRVTAIYFDMQ